MNCKPGDLAVLVRARLDPTHLGKIVSVIKWDARLEGWVVKPPLFTNGVEWGAVKDSSLRRIDNPGDDAVDEVIQRIGTPHKETA